MAEALKILAQTVASTTAAALYTVPASTQTVVSSVIIANTTASAATFRLFATRSGSTYDATTALFFDISVAANSSTTLQLGMGMAAGQALAIRASAASTLTVTAFGQELT